MYEIDTLNSALDAALYDSYTVFYIIKIWLHLNT